MNRVFVYDPTSSDKLSSVRGVGRYLQILKENFSNEFEFVNNETMKQLNNDCIFVNPFFNFLQPPLTFNRLAKKQIAVIHDLIPLKYPSRFPAGIKGSIYILLNKLSLNNYDLIITDSEASKKDIIKILRIHEDKIKVIYPCLPKNFEKVVSSKYQELSIKQNKLLNTYSLILNTKFCLYVGDATWNKNLVNIAKAIKIANVNCVFVGRVFDKTTGVETSGIPAAWRRPFESRTPTGKKARQAPSLDNPWQRELKKFFELAEGDKRFIFPGFIPNSDLIKLYQQARCNILISRDEGFGFSYLEAASQACPSVLADIPVLREIAGRENGLFVNPNDPNEIASVIGKLYFNNALRNNLSFKAQQRAKYFSQNIFIQKWQELTKI